MNSIIHQVVWPISDRVKAVWTTRAGGESVGDYASLNLGEHVGDMPYHVMKNRELLQAAVPARLHFLKQVHGNTVHEIKQGTHADAEHAADASVTALQGEACIVMAADCLPVLISNTAGTVVGAAHCGWRGLSGVDHGGHGILEATVLMLRTRAANIRAHVREGLRELQEHTVRVANRDEWVAWLGPAIGPQHFEVGPEVRDAFMKFAPEDARAFEPLRGEKQGKYRANLFALARMRLARLGVTQIVGGGDCTYAQPDKYYSHRRATHQGTATGRQAAMIWIEGAN